MPGRHIDFFDMNASTPIPLETSGRIPWIDSTKAIAILLIVLGHSPGLNPRIRMELYSFHVPLFLLLSGFLTSRESLKQLGRKLSPLLRSYWIYGAIGYFLWLPWHATTDPNASIWQPLWGMYYGVSGPHYWMPHNAPLWYFPMYASCLTLAFLADRDSRSSVIIHSMALLLLFAVGFLPFELPWGIDKALIGLLFFRSGQLMRLWLPRVLERRTRIETLAIAAVLLSANFVGSRLNGQTNLNFLNLGHHSILFLLNALTGSLALIFACSTLPSNRITKSLAANTIPIFCLHLIVFGVLIRNNLSPHRTATALLVAILVSIGIAMSADFIKTRRGPDVKKPEPPPEAPQESYFFFEI